jgi:hypothetical protein
MQTPERRAAWILIGITAIEGVWVAMNFWINPRAFTVFLGFIPGVMTHVAAWTLAIAVALAYIGASLRLPSVRAAMFRPSGLKALALALAVASGILEEAVFRKLLMDHLLRHGFGDALQVIASALAFGLVHGVWGLFGRSVRAAAGATIATGILGGALAIIYLAAGRNVAPCIVAHFLINAFIEPGLVLAAARGEMGRRVPPIAG